MSDSGAILTVDLDALVHNWRLLAARAAPAECSAAIKADAYGIGIEPAAKALAKAGCKTFFVAHLSEGRRVRAVAPDATIYILNGVLPGTEPAFQSDFLRPVLGSRPEIERWADFARQQPLSCPAAVHVDTGLNRLGLGAAEAEDVLRQFGLEAPFEIALLMSHLVSADEPKSPINDRQVAAFAAIRALAPRIPASLANSSGLYFADPPRLDLARPGYALYGGNPTPRADNPMRPVVRLEAPVIQCRAVEAKDTVGYGAKWTAPGPRRLATLGIGYADGYPRSASGTDTHQGAEAILRGVRCRFAGIVSMDLIVIDITDVPGPVEPGERVTLIGDELTIDTVGVKAGTIGYELLTRLGRRFHRVYTGG